MMNMFETSTRDLSLPLPPDPAFETAQRVRPVKIKTTAEHEQELLAKIPKFKARPVNKKKYQEALHSHPNFRSSILRQQHQKRFVRFVKPFHLNAIYQETPRNKSLYLFESKGELGIFCNTKKQVTVPKEFHFAIDERIPPPNAVADMFDKAPATAAAQTPSPQVVVAAQPVEATAVASSSQVKKEMERKQSVEKHRQRPGQLGKKCLVLANHFPVKVETNNLDISQYYINAAASWLILLLMFWSHSMFGLLDLSISPAISLVNFELIFASK
ncbi:Protein TPX2, partial [Linum perenne]